VGNTLTTAASGVYNSGGTNVVAYGNAYGDLSVRTVGLIDTGPDLRGALISKEGASQTVPTTTSVLVTFDHEAYDTEGFANLVADNTKLTVPAGFSGYARVLGQITVTGTVSTVVASARVQLNGTKSWEGHGRTTQVGDTANLNSPSARAIQVETPWVPVTGGNYFQIEIYHETGANAVVSSSPTGNATWAAIELRR
jgi:hypothetical protein